MSSAYRWECISTLVSKFSQNIVADTDKNKTLIDCHKCSSSFLSIVKSHPLKIPASVLEKVRSGSCLKLFLIDCGNCIKLEFMLLQSTLQLVLFYVEIKNLTNSVWERLGQLKVFSPWQAFGGIKGWRGYFTLLSVSIFKSDFCYCRSSNYIIVLIGWVNPFQDVFPFRNCRNVPGFSVSSSQTYFM